MGADSKKTGFTLPTVLITSVIMLTLLLVAMQLAASYAAALRDRYYNQLAREAAESGLAYAVSCLRSNGMISPWGSKNLAPETNCAGDPEPGQSNTVMHEGNIRTRFTVPPLGSTGGEVQQAYATGYVELLRPSGGVWKTYTRVLSLATGAQTRVDTLAFGYEGDMHGIQHKVFFATIDSAGRVRSVGANDRGQLGAGLVSTAQPTPVRFTISQRAVSVHTNFVSVGGNLMIRDENGAVYGAGKNDRGQLGAGYMSPTVSTPVRFGLPVGVKAVTVNSGWANFVLGNDKNIYAAGECTYGLLGTGDYTVTPAYATACSNRSTPKRVALPFPNPGNPGTIPTAHLVQDRYNAYVIMQNGAVYGWGANDYYQLGRANISSSSTPVRIGDFGNPGKPRAMQLAFDGGTLYILANDGKVYGVGGSNHLEVGKDNLVFRWRFLEGRCMEAVGPTTVAPRSCNDSSQQQFEYTPQEQIKINGKCVENTAGDLVNIRLANCNPSAAIQRWRMVSYGSDRIFRRGASNHCLAANASGTAMAISAGCPPSNKHIFFRLQTPKIRDLGVPGFVQQISTDELFASYRTSDGNVYSTGSNYHGVFGNSANHANGATNWRNPTPVQFMLPAGVKAVDIWSTAYAGRVSNLFVVGDDGKVYGAGSNENGQLGTGDKVSRNTPTPMQLFGSSPTAPRAKHVESGGGTTVIFTTDNRVYTVGNNNRGQLGDGTTTDSTVPILGRYTNVPIQEHLVF